MTNREKAYGLLIQMFECSTCGGKGVLSTVNVNEFQTFPAPGRPL